MAKVLIVEDDEICAAILTRFLAREGHDVRSAHAAQAVEVGLAFQPDLLVADWLLNDREDGIDVARHLFAAQPDLRVIFITGLPVERLKQQLGDLPVADVLEKPLAMQDLFARIRAFLPRSPATGSVRN